MDITAKQELARIARFVRAHPGHYAGHHSRGVVIQIEAIQDGEMWIEYQTVWTMEGAREALGY